MVHPVEVNEAVIGGVLHFRAGQRGKWIPRDPKTLTEMLMKERNISRDLEVELVPILPSEISMVKNA